MARPDEGAVAKRNQLVAWSALVLAILPPVFCLFSFRDDAWPVPDSDPERSAVRAKQLWAILLGAEILAIVLALIASSRRRGDDRSPAPRVAWLAAVVAILAAMVIGLVFRPRA